MHARFETSETLHHLRDEMDRLFTNVWGHVPRPSGLARLATASFPAMNVWETEHDLFFEAELPGVKESDLDLTVASGELTLRGKRGGAEIEEATYHRRERGTGTFARTLRLPVDVDAQRIEATLTDGVLLLKLPKAEAAKPRKITVKTRG